MEKEANPMAKILIVDDKESNLLALNKVLEHPEVEIVRALNGDDALRASLNHDFALAILDVQMPAMDGYELASLLRSDPRTRRIQRHTRACGHHRQGDSGRGHRHWRSRRVGAGFSGERLVMGRPWSPSPRYRFVRGAPSS